MEDDELFALYKQAKAIANKLIDYDLPEYEIWGDGSDGQYKIDYIKEPRRRIEIVETDKENSIAIEGILAFCFGVSMLIVNTDVISPMLLDESGVKGLFLGEKVKKIESNILLQDLRYLYVVSNNKYFYADNNVLYNKDRTRLIAYASRKPEEVFEADDNLKVISTYAFRGASHLKKLIIGKNVKVALGHLHEGIEVIRK